MCWNNNYFNKKTEQWENVPNFFEIVVQRDSLIDRVINDVEVGNLLFVNGQLRYRTWEDKEGQKRSQVHIFAFDVLKSEYLPKVEKTQEAEDSNGNSDNQENIGF